MRPRRRETNITVSNSAIPEGPIFLRRPRVIREGRVAPDILNVTWRSDARQAYIVTGRARIRQSHAGVAHADGERSRTRVRSARCVASVIPVE